MAAVVVDLRQRLPTLIEHGPDLVIRFDRELRHVYASPAVESLTGLPPASFIGWTIRELGLPDELCDLWERELGAVLAWGLPRRFECWLDGPNGRCRLELDAVPEWGPNGEVGSVVSFIRDRTEVHRREVEQHVADVRYRELTHTAQVALGKSESHFRSAFDQAAVGMMLTIPQHPHPRGRGLRAVFGLPGGRARRPAGAELHVGGRRSADKAEHRADAVKAAPMRS